MVRVLVIQAAPVGCGGEGGLGAGGEEGGG